MKAARALNIEDLRRIARSRLPRVVYDYLEGGSEDGVTLKANREVFETIRFSPRTLIDVSKRSQKVTLFERLYESPIGIAPMGATGLFWHDGEVALAHAARSANLPFVLSTHSFVPLERLAWESGGPPWFQLYLPRERETARAMVRRALQAGCEEAGARRAIQLLRAEIDRVLALLGCSAIDELGAAHVRMAPKEAASVLPLPLPKLRTV